METSFATQLLYAFLGGLLPALIWLWFWLREDLHPEPKRLLLKAFAAGAVAIPFVLLVEAGVSCVITYLFSSSVSFGFCARSFMPLRAFSPLASPLLLIGFAATEEVIKYISARQFVLTGKDFDEPVDAMIYLITTALGFAAFENIFFLVPAFTNTLFEGFIVSHLRFLGATLLHAVSSGIIGYAIAVSFYKENMRTYYLLTGIFFATTLHAIFNMLVGNAENGGLGQALGVLTLTSLFLIFAFDRAKKIKRASRFQQMSLPTSSPHI
ncbi:MAG: hypothetical protein A3H64_01905 [Candidatus Ryanbacteria bacterium RIFCSPLOWO2_02_FULL_45_11c]|uniref:Protease PrsW n=1 Tax=Candidatus Ryanbacteria bacterium RIFCSPLOWO2_02_FULL_45_11c TaxID=1802128 RepID=A0A1G2GZG8_9BACT|nr:MAG: hypothetical protein A3H64_01905 [Candidatus Ryanbacteria bacterium RIFCSPLOWO2_02_FULL_45_11c]